MGARVVFLDAMRNIYAKSLLSNENQFSYYDRAMSSSRWVKCISSHGTLRGVAIEATEFVQKAIDVHNATGVRAEFLGEALIAGVILGSYCKPGEKINLNVRSSCVRQALVEALPNGQLRGYVVCPEGNPAHFSISAGSGSIQGSDRVGPWGDGVMSVLRTKGQEGLPPYIGTVPLVTGFLAKDLTFYWFQSEQIPSSVGILLELEQAEGARVRVKHAGGFLVQAMPGATGLEISALEHHIHQLGSLARRFGSNEDPAALLSEMFQDSIFHLLEEKEIQYRCECSLEKVERALLLIGRDELASLSSEGESISIQCDFCEKKYTVSKERLNELGSQSKL